MLINNKKKDRHKLYIKINDNIIFKKVDSPELQEFQRVMKLFEEEE